MQRYSWWLVALVLVSAVIAGSTVRGHAPIASRWNYNEHLFPILRDNCGSCHLEDGVAPMSLVSYQEAYPWSQSIREEVLGLRMPPWQAEDGFGDFKNGHSLAPHEMDMILEWSSGGYPQGPRDVELDPVEPEIGWSLGEPALIVEVPEPFELDAGTSETVRYFVIPTGTNEDRWITAVDFQADARPVVRGVAIYVDATGTAQALDGADAGLGFAAADGQGFPNVAPVALWLPGQQPVQTEGGAGYLLPAGADMVIRIHYKKTWITEGQAFSDQTRVGFYFAKGTAAAIKTMLVESPSVLSGREVSFTYTVDEEVNFLALLPEVRIEAFDVQVVAVKPDGSRVPMLFLREPDPQWLTRYWFESAVSLPQGSQVEVMARLKPGAGDLPGSSLISADTTAPMRFLIDFTLGGTAAN